MGLMEAFQIGEQGGRVSSMAYGPGKVIENIVADARKNRLLETQAMGSVLPSIYKQSTTQNKINSYGPQPESKVYVDPKSGATVTDNFSLDENYGWVNKKSVSNPNQFSFVSGEGGNSIPTTPSTSTAEEAATAWLNDNGAPVTPANIKAVIEKGLVK